ncbi:hypothetical protein [Alistipes onderdonkii]|nr:hypothetical protein [Alistipes onderdonkii]
MKKISFLLAALLSLGLSQGHAQTLKTVRTYYDLSAPDLTRSIP